MEQLKKNCPYLKVKINNRVPLWLELTGQKMTVGKDQTCQLQITEPTVSAHHATLLKEKDGWQLIDNDSLNGLLLNGQRLKKIKLKEKQGVFLGEAEVSLVERKIDEADKKLPENNSQTKKIIVEKCKQKFFQQIERDRERPRLKDREIAELLAAILRQTCQNDFLDFLRPDLFAALEKKLKQDILGLGPLEDLMLDPEISEIMVDGCRAIFVEKNGRIEKSSIKFSDENSLLHVIDRIVSPLGRRIDESSPAVDGRLGDGSRVHAIIRPLAVNGPCLTIRKFKKIPLTFETLINNQTIAKSAACFLKEAIESRCNILISGGTGSGKTTLLNILSSAIDSRERIVTIEDAVELSLPQEHVIALETRNKNIEGRGEVTIRDLVRNSLRMRPDRIIVGECRGGEALDMLQAMNTGHDGSITTLHANDPRDALLRLETMTMMAGIDLPLLAIRQQIARAIDLIIQIERLASGQRRVSQICEICGMESETILSQDIFSLAENQQLRASGIVPNFLANRQSAFQRYIYETN